MKTLLDLFKWTKTNVHPIRKFNSGNDEPENVIVTESIPKALLCCTPHLIPIMTTIAIVAVDLKGVYIGADLMAPVKSETINFMFLQLAAKFHETLIVASLGYIVLQFVRQELLFGEGLPLGLIGSGLDFSNLGFFITKEFYGSLTSLSGHGCKSRKLLVVIVVVMAGLIAALAGPASATLIIPRSRDW